MASDELRSPEYNVCQFFQDDTYEYVRRYVTFPRALEAFAHYCTSVGAKHHLVKRVIITDGDDYTTMEWKWEEGITFPREGPAHGRYKHGVDDGPPRSAFNAPRT